ncbi:MAG: hypothetical protein ACK57J_00925 [Rubrivivax sp.]
MKIEAIEPARAMVEAVRINNWLSANQARMNDMQVKGAREHLHALIDARVKQSYIKSGVLLPNEPDPLLPMLFSWASRLGVYGSDSVYAAVRGAYPVNPPPEPKPPDGFSVQLHGESLRVSSSVGEWQVTVPFHFFIFALNAGPGPDGRRTEAVGISNGSAPDEAPPGYSQATLGLFFVLDADLKTFEGEWAARLQIPVDKDPSVVGETRYRSRVSYDPTFRLHKEMIVVPSQKGAFVILYSGLDGTYQANRPHFLDVLRLLKLPQ